MVQEPSQIWRNVFCIIQHSQTSMNSQWTLFYFTAPGAASIAPGAPGAPPGGPHPVAVGDRPTVVQHSP